MFRELDRIGTDGMVESKRQVLDKDKRETCWTVVKVWRCSYGKQKTN